MNRKYWIALNVIAIVALAAGLIVSIVVFNNAVNDLRFQIDILTGAYENIHYFPD